jgi:hypothetical protein
MWWRIINNSSCIATSDTLADSMVVAGFAVVSRDVMLRVERRPFS